MFRILLLILLFYCTVFSPLLVADDSLTLGIFPRRDAETTFKMFSPLAAYLATQLGRPVVLDVSNDSENYWQKLENGKFDLVHCNQYQYLLAHKNLGFEVIGVNAEFGQTTLSGGILVRKDAAFTSLNDLRGKKIIFSGGPGAMQSCIIPRYLLQQADLSIGDYEAAYAINPPNAVLAVYLNQADAAGGSNVILKFHAVASRINTEELTFLAQGESLVQLPWAVSSQVDPSLRVLIGHTLTTMERSQGGQAALKAACLDRIIIAENKDFDPFQDIVLQVKGETF